MGGKCEQLFVFVIVLLDVLIASDEVGREGARVMCRVQCKDGSSCAKRGLLCYNAASKSTQQRQRPHHAQDGLKQHLVNNVSE